MIKSFTGTRHQAQQFLESKGVSQAHIRIAFEGADERKSGIVAGSRDIFKVTRLGPDSYKVA